jgi:Raf kinase inhibitor-like YbhB/YbcL family protein
VRRWLGAACALALCLAACDSPSPGVHGTPAELTVSSPQLQGQFPVASTCDGTDRQPEVDWSGAPAATQGFAVEMTDTDAPGGSFTHWLVYNIPASTTSLASPPPSGVLQGKNHFGTTGYRGPCPPKGAAPHHYTIAVYALDAPTGLAAGAGRTQLEDAIQPHVIGTGTLEATYAR